MTKNSRTALIITAAGFVLCLAARVVTIICFTDMNTGFLFHGSEALCNILIYGITAVSAAASALVLRKDKSDVRIPENGCVTIGFLTLAAAIAAGYDGYVELSSLTPSLLRIVTGFIGAVYMAILSFVLLYKKKYSPAVGFCYAIIGILCILRAIDVFMTRMVVTAVPEYLAEVLGLILCALFFAMFGRMLSGNSEKNTKLLMIMSGVGASVLTLSSSVGIILAKIFAPEGVAGRITSDLGYAERFYQNNHGSDGYIMTFTPYVNMAFGAIAACAVIVTFVCNSDRNGDFAGQTDEKEKFDQPNNR